MWGSTLFNMPKSIAFLTLSIVDALKLLAIYYKIIAGELHGDFIFRATDKERWVRLDTKILIDNGEFVAPKVSSVIEFTSNDIMNDFWEEMIERGIIHNE